MRTGLKAGTGTIAVIGSANADLVVQVDRRPAAGETILGSDLVVTPGGKGANQAVAAGLLGGDVRFVGAVGADGHGELLRRSLSDAGVDVSRLGTSGVPSGVALICVTPDGENSIVVAPGANSTVTPGFVTACEPWWAGADLVVMQLEVPMATVETVAATCERSGTRFLLNAAPAAVPSPAVLRACDPLVVNRNEALVLLGDDARSTAEPEQLARRLVQLGPRSVVLTLGADGSLALDRDGTVSRRPARTVTAVDTTGAGDAFVGALAVELAGGGALGGGLARATDVAALSVQRAGAQSSYPTAAEVGRS